MNCILLSGFVSYVLIMSSLSLFCHRAYWYHTFLKNQLMHFIFKITLLKHNHSSKTLGFLCPRATLHVSVINLDHPQGYCSCCNATVRLVVFVTTSSGHVAVFSVCAAVVCTLLLLVLLYTVCKRKYKTGQAAGGYTRQQHKQKTQPHAQINL
jgi:hypothetical protein